MCYKKPFENCPDINTCGPDFFLFGSDDDPEHFYVDGVCYYQNGLVPRPTREEVIAGFSPEQKAEFDALSPEEQTNEIEIEQEWVENSNIETCVCTHVLTHQELRDFPYYFKDILLSPEGFKRLDEVMGEED